MVPKSGLTFLECPPPIGLNLYTLKHKVNLIGSLNINWSRGDRSGIPYWNLFISIRFLALLNIRSKILSLFKYGSILWLILISSRGFTKFNFFPFVMAIFDWPYTKIKIKVKLWTSDWCFFSFQFFDIENSTKFNPKKKTIVEKKFQNFHNFFVEIWEFFCQEKN